MTTELEIGLYIFILAGFLGYHVISRVPPLLHTPLMSATNAMSGISLVGSLVVAGPTHGPLEHGLRLHRRGLLLDQRGRRLPHHRPHAAGCSRRERGRAAGRRPVDVRRLAVLGAGAARWRTGSSSGRRGGAAVAARRRTSRQVLSYSYILSAVLFILGLKGLSSPK